MQEERKVIRVINQFEWYSIKMQFVKAIYALLLMAFTCFVTIYVIQLQSLIKLRMSFAF